MAHTSLISLSSNKPFCTPSLELDEWRSLDKELQERLSPWHQQLSSLTSGEDVAMSGDHLILLVREFFLERKDLFTSPTSSHSSGYIRHDSMALRTARKEKKRLKKVARAEGATKEDLQNMFTAIKAVSCLNKELRRRQNQKDVSHQESMYRKNFFRFAKLATDGKLGEGQVEPTFNKSVGDHHFHREYESIKELADEDWSWFPEVKPLTTPFDVSPITPAIIKHSLKRTNGSSAPGFDGVTFSLMAKFPSLHHGLATLYTKILEGGCPPTSWSHAKIKLVHKGGNSTCSPSDFRMISLLPCIGKLFNLILSERLNRYLTKNELIDGEVQKGFKAKCNGVVEHNLVFEEVIRSAKGHKRTAHLSLLDIRDAFGSVNHGLVKYSLQRNGIPDKVTSCIMRSLSDARGQVVTQEWCSEVFSFRSGLMQGAPNSPVLFTLVFNPILDWITSHKDRGFSLDGECTVNCIAFCDDVTIISKDKRAHQKLLTELNSKLRAMGLFLKASKSRCLSICAGKPKAIDFFLNEEVIPSLQEADHKFLGAFVTFGNGQRVLGEKLEQILVEKLSNLDKTCVRGEYKLNIYKVYLLPSLRFLLTVHNISKTCLDNLDNAAMAFLKRWSGTPKCGTRLIFHCEQFLNIPTIHQLYEESHCLALFASLERKDGRVRAALESKRKRDSCTSKPSQLETYYEVIEEASAEAGPDPKQVKSKIKGLVKGKFQNGIIERAKDLSVQGQLLSLAAEEKCDIAWKAFAFSLPKSLLKFGLNAAINVLPSLSNLRRWGVSNSDKCPRCGWVETPKHVLSGCKVFLDQGRYTARHNAVLDQIVRHIDQDRYQVYADLEGRTINGGTVPPSVLVTAEIPDLVMLDRETESLSVFELTVCYEDRLDVSHEVKTQKYASLIRDLSETMSVGFETIEIGARGYINARNKEVLKDLHSFTSNISVKEFIKGVTRAALKASYYIFITRKHQSWIDPHFESIS